MGRLRAQTPPEAVAHLGGRACGPPLCGGIPPAMPPPRKPAPKTSAGNTPRQRRSGLYPLSPIPYPLQLLFTAVLARRGQR